MKYRTTQRNVLKTDVCGFCGQPATHTVGGRLYPREGIISFVGWVCDDPSHWLWLTQTIERLERLDREE